MSELRCNKCNYSLNENYNYCPNCGEPLTEIAKQKNEILAKTNGLLKLKELSEQTKSPAVLKAIRELINK